MFLLLTIGRVISIDMARTKQTGRLARMTDLQQVERHQPWLQLYVNVGAINVQGTSTPSAEVAQVPLPRDVQVVQPKGVPRPEATAMDPVVDEAMAAGPSRRRCHRRTRDIAPLVEVA